VQAAARHGHVDVFMLLCRAGEGRRAPRANFPSALCRQPGLLAVCLCVCLCVCLDVRVCVYGCVELALGTCMCAHVCACVVLACVVRVCSRDVENVCGCIVHVRGWGWGWGGACAQVRM
jgi:hypothetical protein